MDINCVGLKFRDRRIAASDEIIAGTRTKKVEIDGRTEEREVPVYIYGRGSNARRRGARRARNMDRTPEEITTIILHQTSGNFFLPRESRIMRNGRPFRNGRAYPRDSEPETDAQGMRHHRMDRQIRSRHRVDKIAAHFVVMNDGTIFYTHDVEYIINSAGGRHGIDIEFAGTYSSNARLSRDAILAGRGLIRALITSIQSISHIHPHGQVQKKDKEGRCGGSDANNVCGKLTVCPGPDVWVNIGIIARGACGLTSDTTLSYYQNNFISRNGQLRLEQVDPTFNQNIPW